MEKLHYLCLEEQAPHDWAFNRPVQWDFFDRKLERAEAMEHAGETEKAMQACHEIIDACPEYLPAINKLGLLFKQQGRLADAIEVFESAVTIGAACLPEKFELGRDRIPWDWPDNRAFLLACEHLGACHLEKSRELFVYSLALNPGYHAIDELVLKLGDVCRTIGIK